MATLTQLRTKVQEKRCPCCNETFSVEEFGTNRSRKDGKSAYCKSCVRRKSLAWNRANRERRLAVGLAHYHRHAGEYRDKKRLRKFGISPEEYDRILEEQGGVCAICSLEQHEPGRPLHVDHCHSTDSVRGLLCGNCNRGIGIFKDDAERLRSAAAYVEGS